MKDEEILKKAIEKAKKNGWKTSIRMTENNLLIQWQGGDDEDLIDYHEFIFSHSFAKAFWGEENGSPCFHSFRKNKECEIGWHPDPKRPKNEGYYPQWKFHLERMVLEENPIKYLEKFI